MIAKVGGNDDRGGLREIKVIGQEHQSFSRFGVLEPDPSQIFPFLSVRIALSSANSASLMPLKSVGRPFAPQPLARLDIGDLVGNSAARDRFLPESLALQAPNQYLSVWR
jgi:hypothetical protein